MSWKSSWNKHGPVEQRRRELEKQAASLSRQKAALEAELTGRNTGAFENDTELQPVVWNERREAGFTKDEEWQSRSGRPRVLLVQRYRDRNLFIVLASVLLLIVIELIRAVLR